MIQKEKKRIVRR